MSPLKVWISGVPELKPNARVLISCPTSEPDGAICGACGGCPEGSHLPADC